MSINKDEIKRANEILDRASKMMTAKRTYSDFWPSYEKIWKMTAEGRTGEDKWRADLPDTWTFATIKTAQAAFVDSKVSLIVIRHEDDPKSKADDIQDLYADIAEKGNLDLELYWARLDAFKLGNGYLQTIYVKDTRMVWNIKKFDPEKNEFQWEKKEINEFDDLKSVRISPYLVLIDDLARANWDSVRDAIILEVVGRDQAEARYGDLCDFSKITNSTQVLNQVIPGSTLTVAEIDGTGLRGTDFETLQKYSFFAPGFTWSDDIVEIIHYWNKGIMTPSGALDSYEILINGYPAKVDTKQSKSPNPYIHKQIPLTHIPYSPYSGDEHYAAGIVEIGMSESSALKLFREMMVDRQKISLFTPAFIDLNDELDQRTLALKPLGIYKTKGGKPSFPQIPGVGNADLSIQDRFEAAFKRATGIDERILGVQGDSPKLTATEVSFLREAAMKRLKEFAFLYKNALLHGEVLLKLSLSKQYFANPFSKESKTKNDKSLRSLKGKLKEFKVKAGNIYTKKDFDPSYFDGDADIDLDLQLLLPLTQAQMVTMWSQILRDAVPFVQGGIIDISLKKVFEKYVEALGTDMNVIRENKQTLAIEMAETEHKLFADANMSDKMKDVLPNGTEPPALLDIHIIRHQELLDSDVNMGDSEKLNLITHIQKDIQGLQKLQLQQQIQRPIMQQDISGVGGLPGTPRQAEPAPMQPVGMPL